MKPFAPLPPTYPQPRRRRLDDPADAARLLPPLDPYDNELAMPLAEFVRHPIAAELLHDGQALQLLGLTNNSLWERAGALRRCRQRDAGVAAALAARAGERLGALAHVGALEELPASVEAAAAALGLDLGAEALLPPERVRAVQRRAPFV